MKKIVKACYVRLPVIILINVGMVMLLVSMYFLLGGASFSVYVKEMALNIMSVKDAAIYLSILAVYGFAIEFIFRRVIQDRFLSSEKSWVKVLAGVIPILLYVLIHSRYGLTGVIYGAVTGTFLTVLYLWKKDWLTYSLWHMFWGFIVIPLSMITCVFIGGPIRNDFLFAYKKRHILKQKMYYVNDWGWVDKTHYRPDHFAYVKKMIDESSGDGEVVLGDSWVTPLKIPVSFSVKYKFKKYDDPMKAWAQATGIMMDFMRANETVQESSPWYHGNQLSAWQFDDMSSCLLCCLDHLPEKSYFARQPEVHDSAQLLQIWNETGEELVSVKMKEESSWALLNCSKKKELRQLVEEMKGSWDSTGTVMKGPEETPGH